MVNITGAGGWGRATASRAPLVLPAANVLGDPARPPARLICPIRHTMGGMNTILLTRRRDGRLYPAEPPDEAERRRVAALIHGLVCRDQCSIREAQAILLDSYAVRRSVGYIHGALRRYSCGSPRCPSIPMEPATQPAAPEPPAVKVHSSGGALTGMLAGDG
jgi:hypothetical protein